MNSKNDNSNGGGGGTHASLHHTSNHHHGGAASGGHHGAHHHNHQHHSAAPVHHSGHNGLANGTGGLSSMLNGTLNGAAKLFVNNGNGNNGLTHVSSSGGINSSNIPLTQQQIMMTSPSVNMAAVAAYGQQPMLTNNSGSSASLNGLVNSGGDKSGGQQQQQPINDDYSYTAMCKQQIQNIPWFEVEIKGMVKNLSPKLWQWSHLRCLYLNDNNLMRLPPIIASLVHLQCLDASNNKIRALPAEIGDMTTLRDLYLNNNQIRVLPFELGKLFKLQHLGLKGNPLTQDVNQIYSESNGSQKLLIHLLDQLTITCPPPSRRPWMILAEPTPNAANSCIFTTMCYNVLCDKYATRQYYGYCPAWALTWDYRKKLIIDDIKNFNADVIALQELETEQFYQFFLPELRQYDYDGIFSPKSRAKTMAENDKKHVDGCAIFYKTSRFQLVKDYLVEFNQIAMASAEGSEDMLNRVMTKDNIGLAALLEVKQEDEAAAAAAAGGSDSAASKSPNSKEPSSATPAAAAAASAAATGAASSAAANNKQLLLICTAHIHWDPEYCDVKLVQTLMFTNEIKSIIESAQREFRPHQLARRGGANVAPIDSIPVVICADLNSLPESGVIEYLRTGKIQANHADFKELGYDSCLQKFNGSDRPSELSHNLKLDCAYDKEIMQFTNYTYDFKGMIDYIFYSRQLMRTLGLLGSLDMDWLKTNRIVGFPHPHVPSDHLPLIVELELFGNNNNNTQQQQQQQQQHHQQQSLHVIHHNLSASSNSQQQSLRPNQGQQQHHSGANQQQQYMQHHSSPAQSIGQMIPLTTAANATNNNNNGSGSNNNGNNFNFNYLHSTLRK